eukprot:106786_1
MANRNSSDPNTTTSKSNTIPINVKIGGHVKDTFVIHSVYAKEQKMKQILNKITNHVQQTYHPIQYELFRIKPGSFTGYGCEIAAVENTSITEYDIDEITQQGLIVDVNVQFHHEVSNVSISCPQMKRLKTKDATKCTVYREMKENHKFVQNTFIIWNSILISQTNMV